MKTMREVKLGHAATALAAELRSKKYGAAQEPARLDPAEVPTETAAQYRARIAGGPQAAHEGGLGARDARAGLHPDRPQRGMGEAPVRTVCADQDLIPTDLSVK